MKKSILYVQYTDPVIYPPLEHSSALLADRGWEVLFWGLKVNDRAGFLPKPGVRLKKMNAVKPGLFQKIHYLLFAAAAIGWAAMRHARWIYASDPLSCPVALWLRRFGFKRVIYHEHDSPGGGTTTKVTEVVLRARRRLSTEAALCVFPHAERLEIFQRESLKNFPAVVVPNYPSVYDAEAANTAPTGGPLRLYYHGNVGERFLPSALFEALAAQSEVSLTLIGYESVPGDMDALRMRIHKAGAASRVELKQPMPRHEILTYARTAHAGISLEVENPGDINSRLRAGAANKTFEYMACGLGLLVANRPQWARMFVEPGYARACDPLRRESILEQLRWLASHRTELKQMGDAGRQRIRCEWNYEKAFEPVLRVLEKENS